VTVMVVSSRDSSVANTLAKTAAAHPQKQTWSEPIWQPQNHQSQSLFRCTQSEKISAVIRHKKHAIHI